MKENVSNNPTQNVKEKMVEKSILALFKCFREYYAKRNYIKKILNIP